MKRLRLIVWNVLSCGAAVLLLATISLWVRSYKQVDHFIYVRWEQFDTSHRATVSTHKGHVVVGFTKLTGIVASTGNQDTFVPHREFRHESAPVSPKIVDYTANPAQYRSLFSKLIGGNDFWYLEFRRSRGWGVSAPLWTIVALSAVCPLITLVRQIRMRRRNRDSLCIACGYNLTGNISGICPECGTAIARN